MGWANGLIVCATGLSREQRAGVQAAIASGGGRLESGSSYVIFEVDRCLWKDHHALNMRVEFEKRCRPCVVAAGA